MKKIISIMLIAVVLVSMYVMPAFATGDDTSDFKYYDKFCEYIRRTYLYNYQEVYYHYVDENREEPDWTLIRYPDAPEPTDARCGLVVGNRVLANKGSGRFWFVYVREIDDFMVLNQSSVDEISKICPDFIEAIEENEIGQAFGDVDMDDKVTILDATCIQKELAGYEVISLLDVVNLTYSEINDLVKIVRISDYDRDGETTIMDATAIQKMLAGLEI